MGVIITKYETSTDIVFDTSKFDWRYDSDTFPSDANSDASDILLENGDVYNILRQTVTKDSMGKVTNVTEESLQIYGMIQDITIKDRQIHEMGLAVPGNRKLYVMPEYVVTSAGVEVDTWEVKEGDIITDNKLFTGAGSTGQYRVVTVLKQWYLPSQEVYRVAIIKSITLDGS